MGLEDAGVEERHLKSIFFKRCLLCLIVVLTLAGCGQKGPLFLPEDDDQEDDQETSLEQSVYTA